MAKSTDSSDAAAPQDHNWPSPDSGGRRKSTYGPSKLLERMQPGEFEEFLAGEITLKELAVRHNVEDILDTMRCAKPRREREKNE